MATPLHITTCSSYIQTQGVKRNLADLHNASPVTQTRPWIFYSSTFLPLKHQKTTTPTTNTFNMDVKGAYKDYFKGRYEVKFTKVTPCYSAGLSYVVLQIGVSVLGWWFKGCWGWSCSVWRGCTARGGSIWGHRSRYLVERGKESGGEIDFLVCLMPGRLREETNDQVST